MLIFCRSAEYLVSGGKNCYIVWVKSDFLSHCHKEGQPIVFSISALRKDALLQLRRAEVSLPRFAGLLLLIHLILSAADTLFSGASYEELFRSGPVGIFVYILVGLTSRLLEMGRIEYCRRIRSGERAEYADLFWGFSYVFRVLCVFFLQALFIACGLSLFLVPGIILVYRLRFALYILSEDPSLGVMEILRRSGSETAGFKMQIFLLDLAFLPLALVALLPYLFWMFGGIELPLAADVLVGTLLTFPALLLNFWHTTADLALREKILAIKSGSAAF